MQCVLRFKKEDYDPKEYVDILKAIYVTSNVLKDTVYTMYIMGIISRETAADNTYRLNLIMEDIVKQRQIRVQDDGDYFKIYIRSDV